MERKNKHEDDDINHYNGDDNVGNSEKDDSMIMNAMVIFGEPVVGFNTNPEANKRPCFIEVNGEKIVCIAQGGECRYNHNYYSPGLNDRKSWTTPIVEKSCPDACCYKVIVCDDHDEKCEGSIRYYPEYNKFRGQFSKYCRNFDKYVNVDRSKNGKAGEDEKRKVVKKVNKKRMTLYYCIFPSSSTFIK